jgi:altronate hydrolase
MQGYLRNDGRKGIRNIVTVAYTVECAHHVAREITLRFRGERVHLIGFPGCFPNKYAHRMMKRLCTHPNVGAVLLVSLGCEGLNRESLAEAIDETGRPVETLVIQKVGGTRRTIKAGVAAVRRMLAATESVERAPLAIDELVVGTICGGSDATSGITANPAIGRAFDRLVEQGATCIFEETGELIGCEETLAERSVSPELANEIRVAMVKAARYYETLGHGSFAPGNAEGGLTTQEEKSLGAYCKSGASAIAGLIKPGDIPPRGGLYLLDVVPDGEVRFGFPNIVRGQRGDR